MKKYDIVVQEDKLLEESDKVTLHFTYDRNLTLKELTEVLDMTNKAINDFNRDNGVKSGYALSKRYATEVAGVKEGSYVFDLIINVAIGLTTGVLGNCLFERYKMWRAKKKETPEDAPAVLVEEDAPAKYPVSITVNGGTVNVHIHNGDVA